MRWVYVLKTFFIVCSSPVINVLIFLFNFNREDLLSINQLLSISCIIFREVHVNKACKSMSICSNSYVSMLISHSIYNLFLKPSFLISVTFIIRSLSINCIIVHNSLSFLGVELSNSCFLFSLNLILIIFLQLS